MVSSIYFKTLYLNGTVVIKYVFFVVGICWFQIFFVSLYRI